MEASAINQPHPDDEVSEEAEAFFGEPDDDVAAAEQRAEEARSYRETHGEPEPGLERGEGFPDPFEGEEQAAPAAASPEEQAAEAAQAAQETTEAPAAAEEPSEGDAEAQSAAEKARGAIEREYIVFQKVPLTERVLKHMLGQMDSGGLPEPKVAYIEVHRVSSRNDRSAVADAYKTHKARLGEKCDLAAVSARSFKERHVAPRQVVRDNISIT